MTVVLQTSPTMLLHTSLTFLLRRLRYNVGGIDLSATCLIAKTFHFSSPALETARYVAVLGHWCVVLENSHNSSMNASCCHV